MLRSLQSMTVRPLFWLGLAAFGLLLQLVGLFYQHVLNYGPCILCIHVRMWITLLIVLSLVAAGLCRWRVARVLLLLASIAISGALVERAWQLVATERGWVVGSCAMASGLPEWVPLERWFPSVYQIQEACGYTPMMPWGLSMADSLLGLFPLMAIALLALLPGAFRRSPPA